MSIGLAHLWKQNAIRYLASVNLHPETEHLPGINLSAGVQGIGTGNPGFGLTGEKNFKLGITPVNAYVGVGFRTNEKHGHLLGGFKVSMNPRWTLGVQFDGHDHHPFTTFSREGMVIGFYLIQGKSLGVMTGFRF